MRKRQALVTGGAGFLGVHLASRLVDEGVCVTVLDSFSRPGSSERATRLRQRYGDRVRVVAGDVCDRGVVAEALDGVSTVYHLAAQVAITDSVADPRSDFTTNAAGTLTLLEGIRARAARPSLIYASTHKVYGALTDLDLERQAMRYVARDPDVRRYGISETRPLAFHSPYGCSKGAADQYVLEYARCYHLQTVVFRLGCVYGQTDSRAVSHGWIGHFVERARAAEPITINGHGCQVRDPLHVDDLVNAMLSAQRHMPAITGRAFNIGGGPAHACSLLEALGLLEDILGRPVSRMHGPWPATDQRYYVSDHRSFTRFTGWRATVTLSEGIRRLLAWTEGHRAADVMPVSAHLRHARAGE